jgi:transcriptional regulator with XRE-family HTH domain
MTIGERLRKAREKLEKTQKQIADELGKKQPTIHAWESDQTLPKTDEVRAVAAVYGLKPEQLLPERAAS